ncbi:putative polyketide synthase [Xylaria intraflava]|nr:putative polyketide synthase [Xylaria intraflava]
MTSYQRTDAVAADALSPEHGDLIAIVGMGCRWPGGVRNTSQLWDLLREKRDGWAKFDSNRINPDGFYHPNGQRPGGMYTVGGHLLQEDPRHLDHAFFGITATEALSMDPTQRKLLEVTYEAFENAGETWDQFAGSRTGVFVGNFNNEHQVMQLRDPDFPLPYSVTGGGATILSNRINYVFNLRGPSMMVDTACSASMYALHIAVMSIQNGDCDAAIVAGGNLILTPDAQVLTTKLGAISPTSRSHTFDAAADGYARAEGFGALYVKKLSDAVARGDPIRAVLRGSAFNANGKTGGISHPSPEGQEAVIREAYKASGNLDPALTGYFECHGTGTPVGDPIEVTALGRVFSSVRDGDDPLLIGSIKPNLGHSEPASALAQIMKVILAMEHRMIPATIGIETFNPAIDFEKARAKVVTEMTPWPSNRLRRVSINSFGYGGANAHCILDHPSLLIPGYKLPGLSVPKAQNVNGTSQTVHPLNGDGDNVQLLEWCRPYELTQAEAPGTRPVVLIPFSAHDESALKASIASLSESTRRYDLSDLLFTLSARRSTFPRRAFAILEHSAVQSGIERDALTVGKAPSSVARNIAFVFTGQGAQWPEMGLKLIHEYHVFKQTIRYLDDVLAHLHDGPSWTIEEVLAEGPTTSRIHESQYSQTVCTALQIALVSLLEQWGIRPVAAVGHSSGEIAAAYAAGRLRASEAIAFAYYRGQAVSKNDQRGLMLAVGLGPNQVAPYMMDIKGKIQVAAVNSPESVTISGESEPINELAAALMAHNVFNRILKTGNNAYHSHHMLKLGTMYEELASQGLRDIKELTEREPRRPSSAWISSVNPDEQADATLPGYWRQNLESPVLFSDAVLKLSREVPIDLLIEVGPHPALSGPIKQIRSFGESKGQVLPPCLESLRRGEHDVLGMLKLAGRLFLNNAQINLVAVNATERLKNGKVQLCHGFPCVDMPQYTFTYPEKPVYFENRFNREHRTRKYLRHDLLGSRQPGSSRVQPSWRNVLRIKDLPWLSDHKLVPHAVLPAAAYVAMAVEAARQMHNDGLEPGPIKSFKLRNVAVNSTMKLEDNELGVETVLNMGIVPLTNTSPSSEWYSFSISSIAPETDAWTEHCSGTISVETEAMSGDEEVLQVDPRSRLLDIDRWYEKFEAIGLGYGPTFRCLSNLRAYHGAPTAAADVALSSTADTIKGGESEYALHPASLDACLQLALIAIHSGQVENADKGFVPILLNNMSISPSRSSGSTGQAVAIGEILGIRSAYAQIQLRSPAGHRLLDIGELKCAVYDGGTESAKSSASTCEPYWRTVSSIDVDTLTNDFAQVSFPPAILEAPVMEKVDSLYEHILVDAARTFEEARVSEQKNSHSAFAQWVQDWRDSSASQAVSDLNHDQLVVRINDLFKEVGDIPEAACFKILHENISAIIGGETNSIKLLMDNNLLGNLYASGIAVREAYTQLRRLVDIQAHKAPRMRILEIGGKTGGAASVLLDTLGSNTSCKRFHEYVFTDPSERSILDAQAQFNGYRGVTFQVLDIESDLEAQGFQTDSFDLILLNGSLNLVNNPATTLQNVYKLLRPGASLVILSPKHNRLSLEVLNRLTAGRWGDSTDQIIDANQWHRLLVENGFLENKVTLEDYADSEAVSTLTMTTKPDTSSRGLETETAQDSRVYLVYRDYPPPLAGILNKILRRQNVNCVYVDLLSHDKIPASSHIISLVDIEDSTMLHRGKEHFRAIQAMLENTKILVWVADGNATDASQCAVMKGMLRSIANESAHIDTAFIEMRDRYLNSLTRTAELILYKFNELRTYRDGRVLDRECVLANNNFYIERLLPNISLNEAYRLRHKLVFDIRESSLTDQGPLKASYMQPGLLSSLYFEPDASFQRPLKEGWVQIKTEAIGLNMKDIAIATGKFDANHSSHEAAGVVCRVGPGVTSFKEGDRVFGLIIGKMGNYMRSPETFISKIPEGQSFASAASMPISYLTAIYALKHVARLTQGESVLIQSAAGSLGLAAIRIAQQLGAEIYVTVGGDHKRKFIAEKFNVPLTHIFQSRAPGIVESIMRQTKGKGIDVILNSVAGNAMHEMWRCIAPLGRFLDLGRTDVLGAGKISLEMFKRNATFSSFDLTRIMDQKPEIIERLMVELKAFWEKGSIGPIDEITSFKISELTSAMTFFSKGQHIGKVVIRFDDSTSTVKVMQGAGRVTFDPEAAYLLVGCLGGLGRSLAIWMIERGARHLVFLSRSGGKTSEAKAFLQELIDLGGSPQVIQGDVTDYDTLESAVGVVSKQRAVKGVVHAAMVEGDGIFSQTTHAQVQKVLAPKVVGTTNLHRVTRGFPLDFFVMTSSIVGVVGTPSQSAYCAAGAFQDAFAWMRKSQGLPATSIDLGLILEVGSVSGSKKTQQMLQRVLTYGQSETEFLLMIEGAFGQSSSQSGSSFSQSDSDSPAQVVCGLDPARFLPWVDSGRLSDFVWHENARFQTVAQAIHDKAAARDSAGSQSTDSSSSWSKRLRTASSAQEQTAIAQEAVVTHLAKLLSIEADDIDARKAMSHYGLDSLVAAELRNWLMKSFGVEATVLQLLSGTAKIGSLADMITKTWLKKFKTSKFSDEVSLEAKRDKLVLTAINTSKSAYGSLAFTANRFFSKYHYAGVAQNHDKFFCKLYNRALLSLFRSRSGDPLHEREKDTTIERCEVTVTDEPRKKSRIVAKIVFRNGITTKYRLPFEVSPPVHAKFDKTKAMNNWVISSRTLRQLMDHFGPGIDYLDINAEDDIVNFTCFTERVANGDEVLKKPLQTSIAVARDEFDSFHVSEDGLHIVISVKDFRAIIQHASILGVDVSADYSTPANPMQLKYDSDGIKCEFLFMTIGERRGPDPKAKKTGPNAKTSGRPQLEAMTSRANSHAPTPAQTASKTPSSRPNPMPSLRPPIERPSQRPPPATLESESLFVPQDNDEQWEPVNVDEEEEEENARLSWDTSGDLNSTAMNMRPAMNNQPSIPKPGADIDFDPNLSQLEPTQRLSQARKFGLFGD